LVAVDSEEGERRSTGGILIPATAEMSGHRLSWCRVVAIGSNVRSVEVDDRVLFDPEDKAEVEVAGEDYGCSGSATSTPWPLTGWVTP
jgi:chaperonin GroES